MAVSTLRDLNRQARFQARLKDQIRLEQNGYVDPELASRLTRSQPGTKLFQVVVDVKGESLPMRCSPMMIKTACEMVLEQINKSIINGVLKGWGNARIEPVLTA